jgi:hypothetical protein
MRRDREYFRSAAYQKNFVAAHMADELAAIGKLSEGNSFRQIRADEDRTGNDPRKREQIDVTIRVSGGGPNTGAIKSNSAESRR